MRARAILAFWIMALAAQPALACGLEIHVDYAFPATGLWYTVGVGDVVQRGPLGEDGRAVLDGLPCGSAKVVVGFLEGFPGSEKVRPLAEASAALVPGMSETLRFVLQGVVPVSFASITEAEEPFPNTWVSVVDEAEGGFETFVPMPGGSGVAYLKPGPYAAELHTPWRLPVLASRIDGLTAGPKARFRLESRPTLVAFVVKDAPVVRGRVEASAPGPLEGIQVNARAAEDAWRCVPCGVTSHDGTFAIPVQRLPVMISLHDPSGTWRFEPSTLEARSPEPELVFQAMPNDAPMLMGRVTNGEGTPIPEASILASTEDGAYRVRSDAGGRFRVPCTEGRPMSVQASKPDQGYLPARWRTAAAVCTEPVVLRLRRGATIEGAITAEGGLSVEGVRVVARDSRGGVARTVASGGHYRLAGMRPGTYTLSAEAPESNPYLAVRRSGASGKKVIPTVTVGPGESRRLDLELREGGRICMEAVDDEGKPLRVRRLELYGPGAGEPAYVFHQKVGRRDACTSPVPPGAYRLRYGEEGGTFPPLWWPEESDPNRAESIRVRAGRTEHLGPVKIPPLGAIVLRIPPSGPDSFALLEIAEPAGAETDRGSDRLEWMIMPPDRWKLLDSEQSRRLVLEGVPPGAWHVRACEVPSCESGAWTTREPVQVRKYERAEAELHPFPGMEAVQEDPLSTPGGTPVRNVPGP